MSRVLSTGLLMILIGVSMPVASQRLPYETEYGLPMEALYVLGVRQEVFNRFVSRCTGPSAPGSASFDETVRDWQRRNASLITLRVELESIFTRLAVQDAATQRHIHEVLPRVIEKQATAFFDVPFDEGMRDPRMGRQAICQNVADLVRQGGFDLKVESEEQVRDFVSRRRSVR
jgi:hypothetical protein